jgi:hypothetical protein
MAPTNPTRKPLVTSTHFALVIAAVSVASAVYVALGDPSAGAIPTAAMAVAAVDLVGTAGDRRPDEFTARGDRPGQMAP